MLIRRVSHSLVWTRAPRTALFITCAILSRAMADDVTCSLPRKGAPPPPEGLSDGCVGAPLKPGAKFPIPGTEAIMSPKAHGTSARAVQAPLRWGCDAKLADRICSFNRHYAEPSGSFLGTSFLTSARKEAAAGPITFYDSVTGRPLFRAPIGRTFAEFEAESKSHGWPSFRNAEVVWDDVRVLPDGEAVSIAGTHLGHNLPDRKGDRYCINLVSVAALPPSP